MHSNGTEVDENGNKIDNMSINDTYNFVRINNDFNLHFDNVLGAQASQEVVYSSLHNICDDFLVGNNCALLTYGVEGSGKTYTMFGTGDEHKRANGVIHLGIVPRVFSYVLEKLSEQVQHSNGSFQFQLTASFAELYNVCDKDRRVLDDWSKGLTISVLWIVYTCASAHKAAFEIITTK